MNYNDGGNLNNNNPNQPPPNPNQPNPYYNPNQNPNQPNPYYNPNQNPNQPNVYQNPNQAYYNPVYGVPAPVQEPVIIETPEVIAARKAETADYKKALLRLAVAMILMTLSVPVTVALVSVALNFIPLNYDVFYVYEFSRFASSLSAEGLTVLTADGSYALDWFLNDFVAYVAPLIIFALFFGNRLYFQKKGEPYDFKFWHVITFFLAGITTTTVASYINAVIADYMRIIFGTGELRDVFASVTPQNDLQSIVMFISVAIVAPICEELLFRRYLLRPLRRYGDMQAVLITAVLFGFYHGNFTQFLYACAGGIVLGTIAVRANSVVASILVHSFNNGYELIKSELFGRAQLGTIPLSYEAVDMGAWGVLILGGILAIYLLARKRFKLENDNEYIPSKERAQALSRSPAIWIMVIVLFAATVIGS